MIGKKVEKKLKEAFFNFGEKEGVAPNEIAFMIQCESEQHMPYYTYMAKGVLKMVDEERRYIIDFTKEVLKKRTDLLNIEGHVANYLGMFYNTIQESMDMNPYELQIIISYFPNSDSLGYNLIKGREHIKQLELSDIFIG